MATNPLTSYAETVTGAAQDDPAEVAGPVGLLTDDPFAQQPMSQALYNEFNPPPVPVAGEGGDFNDDAKLDTDQVVRAPSIGVPLNLPGVPGYAPPPPELQSQSWFDSVAKSIDAAGQASESLKHMFDAPGAELPVDQNAIGLPSKVEYTAGNTPTLGDFTAPQAQQSDKQPTPTGEFITDNPDVQAKIVGAARAFVGNTAFAYGGSSFGGSSREGMVQLAYGKAGVPDMPALAQTMAGRGKKVPLSKLKPGDLVTWAGEGHMFGHDRVGIFVGNGQLVTATQKAGFHVMNLSSLNDPSGVRVRNSNNSNGSNGSVSLAASDSAAQSARAAAQATVDAVNNIFGKKAAEKKKQDQKKKSSGGSKGGNRDAGSKFYGSEKKDSGNSSKKYSGIGATK